MSTHLIQYLGGIDNFYQKERDMLSTLSKWELRLTIRPFLIMNI